MPYLGVDGNRNFLGWWRWGRWLMRKFLGEGVENRLMSEALPLPDDPLYINLVASYWMTLIAPFLARADFEITVFIGRIGGKHRLVAGFRGASSQTLASLLSTPQAFAEQHIVLEDAPWVRDHVSASHGLAKLSSYLDQPRLSLRMALDTYLEVFTGA